MKKIFLFLTLLLWLSAAPICFGQSPQLQITSPKEKEIIQGSYTVFSFKVQNFVLQDYHLEPPARAGEGHLHLCLDKEFADMNDPGCREHIFLNDEIFTDLKGGVHFISAELVGNDHQPFSPAIRKRVNFTVNNPRIQTTPSPSVSQNSSLTGKSFYRLILSLAIILVFLLLGFFLWLVKKKER